MRGITQGYEAIGAGDTGDGLRDVRLQQQRAQGFADGTRVPPFIHDEDAFAGRDRGENLFLGEWRQPAKVNDSKLNAVLLSENFLRLPAEIIPITISQDAQLLTLPVYSGLTEGN